MNKYQEDKVDKLIEKLTFEKEALLKINQKLKSEIRFEDAIMDAVFTTEIRGIDRTIQILNLLKELI